MADDLARLFLAVPLTDDARHRIAHLLDERLPRGIPGRSVRPGNWHVTLRFFGDVDHLRHDRIAAALDQADLGSAFVVRWDRLGAFPRPQRATVLWLGVDRGDTELCVLAAAVEGALEAAGEPPEDRPFRAHLTLSRIRPFQDVRAVIEAAGAVAVAMPVGRVVLYRSHLGAGGARYEEIEEFPFA